MNTFSRSHFSVYFTIGEITRFVLGEHPSTVNSEHFLRSPVLLCYTKKHLSLVKTAIFPKMFISPYLFNVYVDDLSVKLNSCHVGCYYSGGCINHLMYADDLVIMSPSVAGLNKLLHICESFGLSHDVLFNNKKSTIMSFRAGNLKDAHLPLYKCYVIPLVSNILVILYVAT